MAKLVKQLRNLLIKETTPRDNSNYKFLVTLKNGDVEWECDSIKEAEDFITLK